MSVNTIQAASRVLRDVAEGRNVHRGELVRAMTNLKQAYVKDMGVLAQIMFDPEIGDRARSIVERAGR